MNKQNITNTPREQRRSKFLTVRVTPHLLGWLKKNNYSITKIFYEAIKDLGYKK